ncbi:MAG: hypothetical protein NTY01_25300 [Verrucomicrobia bacterium]|nr:hypothetical protein [Verrucomicrobiota bacterium]
MQALQPFERMMTDKLGLSLLRRVQLLPEAMRHGYQMLDLT